MFTRKNTSIALMLLCIITFIVISVIFAPQAEDAAVLLLFMFIWFPPLPIIAVTELISLLTDFKKGDIEKIGLILSAIGAFLMFSFWFLMILVGGNQNMSMGLTVISVNIASTLLLMAKIRSFRQ